MNSENKELKKSNSSSPQSFFDFTNKVEFIGEGDSKVSIKIKELPHTFGTTISNCLRRVIYQFSRAAEVVAFTISNGTESSKSEFGSLPGISETVLEITSRLRRIVFSSQKEEQIEHFISSGESFKGLIKVRNDSEKQLLVTAKDIQFEDNNFSVKNLEIEILTLAPHSEVKLEIFCILSSKLIEEKKWETADNDLQWISSDSKVIRIGGNSPNYTSIKAVSFSIDKIIVNTGISNEDLILTLETDHSINPRIVIMRALSICKEIFTGIGSQIFSKNSTVV